MILWIESEAWFDISLEQWVGLDRNNQADTKYRNKIALKVTADIMYLN